MLPLVSDLKETPSSRGESGPASTVAGTVLLGQIVCWAEEPGTQPNRITTAPNIVATHRPKRVAREGMAGNHWGLKLRNQGMANLSDNISLFFNDIAPGKVN